MHQCNSWILDRWCCLLRTPCFVRGFLPRCFGHNIFSSTKVWLVVWFVNLHVVSPWSKQSPRSTRFCCFRWLQQQKTYNLSLGTFVDRFPHCLLCFIRIFCVVSQFYWDRFAFPSLQTHVVTGGFLFPTRPLHFQSLEGQSRFSSLRLKATMFHQKFRFRYLKWFGFPEAYNKAILGLGFRIHTAYITVRMNQASILGTWYLSEMLKVGWPQWKKGAGLLV